MLKSIDISGKRTVKTDKMEKDFYFYKNIVMGIMIVLIIFFLFVYYPFKERIIDSYMDLSYNGVVEEKFISMNHNVETIKLESKEIISLIGNSANYYTIILRGDSMVKNKGSLVGYIFRNKKVFDSIDYNIDIEFIRKR
jgi:hypothetical protein